MPLSRLTGNSFNATANTNIDNGLLFINPTTNRVGVNTTTPEYSLQVNGTTSANLIQSQSPNYPILQMKNDALATDAFFRIAYDTAKNLVFQKVNNEYTSATEFMRLDSAGGFSIGTVTSLATLTVKGNICPSEAPSSKWGLDFAPSAGAGGAYITLANNATYDLAVGSGLVYLFEDSGNGVAQAYCFYGTVSVTNITAALFTSTSGTSGKINLYYNGVNNYRIQNLTGGTRNIWVSTIKLRAST